VIVVGDDTRERIIAKGIDPGRVVVVRDGALMPMKTSQENGSHPVTREVRTGYPFVVLHAGNLGYYGAWGTVVKAARTLNGDGVGFVFVGDGAARSQVESSAEGCKAIRFQPFRPTDQVPYVLAAGDIHLITIRRGLEGVVVPSKLYPILAAGRPVLVLAHEECDAARLVRRSGCGVVVNPDDPAALVSVLRELSQDPERVARMADRAAAVSGEFNLETELQRFVAVIEDAAQEK
jgi:glycosyltransferase involved in cell wall biosynthesis